MLRLFFVFVLIWKIYAEIVENFESIKSSESDDNTDIDNKNDEYGSEKYIR